MEGGKERGRGRNEGRKKDVNDGRFHSPRKRKKGVNKQAGNTVVPTVYFLQVLTWTNRITPNT